LRDGDKAPETAPFVFRPVQLETFSKTQIVLGCFVARGRLQRAVAARQSRRLAKTKEKSEIAPRRL